MIKDHKQSGVKWVAPCKSVSHTWTHIHLRSQVQVKQELSRYEDAGQATAQHSMTQHNRIHDAAVSIASDVGNSLR